MIFNIMVCSQCEDKWFMEDDFEDTYPECHHCENCGASGTTIKYIVVKSK
jgi:hypothetical protein